MYAHVNSVLTSGYSQAQQDHQLHQPPVLIASKHSFVTDCSSVVNYFGKSSLISLFHRPLGTLQAAPLRADYLADYSIVVVCLLSTGALGY
jgi:hypothetical protein